MTQILIDHHYRGELMLKCTPQSCDRWRESSGTPCLRKAYSGIQSSYQTTTPASCCSAFNALERLGSDPLTKDGLLDDSVYNPLHNGQNLPLYHTPISALFIADKNIYLRRASYGRGNRAPFLDSSASRARPGIACIKCAVSLDTYEPYARRLRNLDILTHLYPATNSDYSRLSLSLSRN